MKFDENSVRVCGEQGIFCEPSQGIFAPKHARPVKLSIANGQQHVKQLLDSRTEPVGRMEEIEYKLRKKNAVLVVNAISKLVETIKTKGAPHSNRIEELPELQLLKQKCEDPEPLINMAACQGMVALVEMGMLSIIPTLTSIIASLSSVRNYSGTVSAIGALLITDLQAHTADKKQYQCPFGMKAPQHPFITVLRHSKETCFHVLSQIQYICNHPEKNISGNSMELLRPVFLYALCDPSLTSRLPILCRRQMWTLLLHSTSPEFLLELISWFQMEGEAEVYNMSCMLVELAELAVRNNDAVLCAALAPFVASTTHRLVCYGYDPGACLTVLIQLLELGPEAGSVVLSVLANTCGMSPVPYLKDIISCCIWMVNSKLCNLLSAGMLVSYLLQWLLYPSYITGEALQLATTALATVKPDTNWVSRTSQLCRNKYFSYLRCSDALVDLTTEICRISETWQSNPDSAKEWLQRFSEHLPSGEHWMPILSGMFIHHLGSTATVLQLLLKLVERNADLSGHVLTLLLYKLSSEKDPQSQLQMLRALTKMAVQKENVALVLHTLESLKHEENMRPLLLDLYVRLWKVEIRCYPYLQKLLTEKELVTWELNIAKAMAIKEICDTRPGQYGADLVKLLSQILNECVKEEGAIPSSLALKGIASLCQAEVVDVATTWRALAPRLNKDKRPLVLQSLCEFLKVVMTQRITNQEYEKLVTEVVRKLWALASHNHLHPDVTRAAFGALSHCEMEQLSLKTLPECYKQNLKLPSSYIKTPMDAARKPEEVLNYIPGECWIQLLQNTREEVLDAAGDMLTQWIASEVQLFRSGLYSAPRGEPSSYTQLHHRSVLKAISSHVSAKAECCPEDNMAMLRQCLRVLAYKGYCQPLPPLNWMFLTNYLPYPELRSHCLTLAAVQAAGSPSARKVVEDSLHSLETTEQNVKEIILFYDHLEQLCKGIAPNVLKPFLEKTLNFSLARGDAEEPSLLSKLLAQIKAALRREDIHDANRQMLSLVIESLLEKLDINNKVFEDYVSCVTELSSKYVERMSSPSVWWEVTPEKLRQSFIIRSALASKGDTEVPLVWLNECIDATLNLPGEHTSVLGRLTSVVSQCREHDSNSRWTMELLGQIHVVLNKKNEEDVQQSLIFLCDVFILTVVVISGHDLCALTLDNIVSSRESRLVLFPQALATLLRKETWNSLSSQIMEWVYHMQNTSSVPDLYGDVFRRSLIALRHTKYFKDSNVWMRFVSPRSTNTHCI